MKKILAGLMVLIGGALVATQSFDGAGSPPFISQFGGMLFPGAAISYGVNPGDQAGNAIPCSADVAITAGDVVIISSGTTYVNSVTKTTTAASTAALGIALNTVTAAGQTVYVRTRGIARVKTAVLVTKGNQLITSGTAGSVTLSSSVTETLYTPLSVTALVATAMETTTASGFAVCVVSGR